MRVRVILIAFAVVFLMSAAQAQLVVGSDYSPSTIFYIDLGTGMATPLYSGGPEGETWGMAYDPATNNLYWCDGSTLYMSPFSMSGLTPTLLGTITYNGATVSFVGLGFRDGKLLGTRNVTTEAVYEIDPATQVATLLWAYPSGDYDFGGLDVDATTNLLYGLSDDSSPVGRGLYEIDVVAQAITFRAPYPDGETDIDGLATYNGLAYYVVDQPGLFYIYDIASGTQVGTITSPFTGSAVFSAAAYVSEGPVSIERTSWSRIKSFYR
jgi:hypothetical protein